MAENPTRGGLDAGLLSVEAHGMLNSLTVALATVATLRSSWGEIDEEHCLRLLGRAEEQLVLLSDTLTDLVRGIPIDTRTFLDELRQDH